MCVYGEYMHAEYLMSSPSLPTTNSVVVYHYTYYSIHAGLLTLLKKGARVAPLGVLIVMFIFDTPRVL